MELSLIQKLYAKYITTYEYYLSTKKDTSFFFSSKFGLSVLMNLSLIVTLVHKHHGISSPIQVHYLTSVTILSYFSYIPTM